MSVNSYLTSLSSSLVLTRDESISINTSINTLITRLNLSFPDSINKQFQFGSSTRGTILPRRYDVNSDIDYLIEFKTSYSEIKKPQTYLNYLKTFAENKYSTSLIKQSFPTIVLELNHIKFELVPSIKTSSNYLIPSKSFSDWIETNPNEFNSKLTNANTNNYSMIKPLVRLIKYWNAKNNYCFLSYELENYICDINFFNCRNLNDYFYTFWEKINYSHNTSIEVKNKVDKMKQYVSNIKIYERMGQPALAEIEIKKIL